ncbi:PepSY domain-containing protein [Pollutibacter soli]|uniref:PepSY domain-containing protein n=1 Tax=Pollutibacter soli TaxID=3034157 RepID=UPI0030137AC9
MKKLVSAAAICLMLLSCDEKKISASDVPSAVVSAFNQKYPGASDVKWQIEKENDKQIYEAEFKMDGKQIDAEFDADGTFIREE